MRLYVIHKEGEEPTEYDAVEIRIQDSESEPPFQLVIEEYGMLVIKDGEQPKPDIKLFLSNLRDARARVERLQRTGPGHELALAEQIERGIITRLTCSDVIAAAEHD